MTNFQWKEIDENRFEDMLKCLPPRLQLHGGFLFGEAYCNRTCSISNAQSPAHHAFLSFRPSDSEQKFYESIQPLTIAEFRTTNVDEARSNLTRPHRVTFAADADDACDKALAKYPAAEIVHSSRISAAEMTVF